MKYVPNPNAANEIKRMAVRNLTPKYQAALAKVTCPNHGEHPSIEAHGDEWSVRACCEKDTSLGLEAIRKVNDG